MVWEPSGKQVIASIALKHDYEWEGLRWTAAAKVYPKYTGDLELLRHEYNKVLGYKMSQCFQRVANAALRHAIDAGQIVAADWDATARAARDWKIANAVLAASLNVVGNAHFQGVREAILRSVDVLTIIKNIK